MEALLNQMIEVCTNAGSKILLAIIVFFVGKMLITKMMHILEKNAVMDKLEGAVRTFSLSAAKGALYVILVVTIIGILGVPMASVITVIASAGVAVGLALQGALSNLAGGIMLVIFKPFRVGDYVDAAGVSGVVKEVTLFYTVLITVDNCRVTIPNGTLMNANVVDYSTEETRRVDINFGCAKSEKPAQIQSLAMGVMSANEKVLSDPAPIVYVTGGTNEAMQFSARAWCKNEDYWDVYFELTQNITEALGEAGINAPGVRVIADK